MIIFNTQKSKLKNENNLKRGLNNLENIEELEAKTELEAKIELTPLVNNSKTLLKTYGITENDLIDIFSGFELSETNNPYTILIGLGIFVYEKENNSTALEISNLFTTKTYAQNSAWGRCAGEAGGLTAVVDIVRKFAHQNLKDAVVKAAFKKALRKALIKVSSRLLGGWVSVGLFTYQMGNCMGWWFSGGNNPLNINDCNDLVRVSTKYWNQYEPFVYISKKSISYVSNSEYNINSVEQYDIYKIDYSGKIGSSDCSVTRTGRKIFLKNLDSSSIEGYLPPENDIDEGGRINNQETINF